MTIYVLPLTPVRLLADVGVHKEALSTREIYEEADPEDEEACFSIGRMTIDYASGETGAESRFQDY